MENRLKPETTPVISNLKQADIRVFMVTGKITFMIQRDRDKCFSRL